MGDVMRAAWVVAGEVLHNVPCAFFNGSFSFASPSWAQRQDITPSNAIAGPTEKATALRLPHALAVFAGNNRFMRSANLASLDQQ